MSCKFFADKEKTIESTLYKELLKITGDESIAEEEFNNISNSGFKELFGDYEDAHANGFSEDINLEEQDKFATRVYDTGEPKLFKKRIEKQRSNGAKTEFVEYNQYYYKLQGGKKKFIQRVMFPGFQAEQIEEVSKYLLYSFVTKYADADFDNLSGLNKNAILSSIRVAMEEYKQSNFNDPEVIKRAEMVLANEEEFKEEVINRIQDLGVKYKQIELKSDEDKEGDPIPEDEKGGGINIMESFEKDPSASMSARIKIMLSQLPEVTINPEFDKAVARLKSKFNDQQISSLRQHLNNGVSIPQLSEQQVNDLKTQAIFGKAGDFLGKTAFVEFKEVQETLMPILSDIVGFNNGTTLTNVFDQMMAEVKRLNLVKPWTSQLLRKMNDMDSIEKRAEFVQAFSKVKLNFYVTEYNTDTKEYKVFNATATNSKDSQVRQSWNNQFRKDFLVDGKLSKAGREHLVAIQDDIKTAMKDHSDRMRTVDNSNSAAVMEAIRAGVVEITDILNEVGSDITPGDFEAHVKTASGDISAPGELLDLQKGAQYMLEYILNPETKFTENEESINPFDNQDAIKAMSRSRANFLVDMSDSNVLANGGKSYYAYTVPSYVHNTVNLWKSDLTELKAMSTRAYNKGSRWLKHFTGSKTYLDGEIMINDETKRDEEARMQLDKLEVGLSTSFKSKGKNDGTDPKEIKYVDALNDSVSKVLGFKVQGRKSYAQTIIPADKGRKIEIGGVPTFDSGIDFVDGEWRNLDELIDVYTEYYEAEYNRMKEAKNELISLPANQLIVHYHTGNKNAFKSQLFPELSPENMDKNSVAYSMLFTSEGLPLGADEIGAYSLMGLTEDQRMAIRDIISDSIKESLDDSVKDFNQSTAVHIKSDGSVLNISVDDAILKAYKDGGSTDPMRALIADHFANSTINTIEYNKMFLGDPAYFKNMPDMIKRTPASYTDGLPLYLTGDDGFGHDDVHFNQATIKSPEIASQYLQLIKDSVKDKSIADAYDEEGINMADAQAWITPDRWRFLKKRLGQWTIQHDVVYDKMMNGSKFTKEELKLAAQPLKGVYFEINNNAPTYLKYSQAVLIPQLVKNTPMKKVLDKMTKDDKGNALPYHKQVHEVVTNDGIKAGAMAPTTIHNPDGTIAEKVELNPKALKNRGWKLQQDLPTKTVHETMVGSQIQKNILAGIDMATESGVQLAKDIHDVVSSLSDMGKEKIMKDFKVDENMKIQDKEKLYSSVINEYKRKGGNNNVVSALEKEMAFDAIPQIRNKVESIFMSSMNAELTKIYTNGGSFIQVSPFGLQEVTKGKTSRDAGIKIVSDNYDGVGLKPPHYDSVTKTYKPGQCMMPHSALIGLLPKDRAADYTQMNGLELMKLIDPEALKMITYRIPNQGMSSNDAMEIVGFLPEGCGDQIIAYDAVPAKTGSDFDIDKMYVMIPHLHFNQDTQKVERVASNDSTDVKSVQNKLIELYEKVLLSEYAYDKVMTSIDANFLKDDIVGLFPESKMKNLTFYSPRFQLRTKFEYLSGKTGVAQTANQLVDHVLNKGRHIGLNEYIGAGHMSAEGTKLDQEFDTEGRHRIADAVSAFLNAYVDIAKDPYVSRGNHNNVTSGTTFLLIRSGVPIEWVNRFIGQPILKELVELIKNSEGISSDKLKIGETEVTPMQYILDKYKIDPLMEVGPNDVSTLYGRGKESLEVAIKDEGQNEQLQVEVLNAFRYLQGRAKHLNMSVQASKTPDYGNFGQLLVAYNKYLQVLEDGEVYGFKEKFTDTMTGTYKKNGIDWVRNLAKTNKLFLSADSTLEGTINSIATRTGNGPRATNEDLVKAASAGYYTYLMSGFKMFKNNRANMNALFTDIPLHIEELKKTSTNFLIQELEVRFSGGYNYLKINSKNKPKVYVDKIYRSWLDLLRSKNPAEMQLGQRLIRYAFSQSGFQNNLNQFFTYIPHEALYAMGVNEYIEQAHLTMHELATDDKFREQLFRHNADDRNLVPQAKKGNMTAYSKGFPIAYGFIYNPTKEEKTGKNNKDMDTYPEFLTVRGSVDMITGIAGPSMLYKLEGLVGIPNTYKQELGLSEKPEISMRPAYVRTFKLGTKSNHGSILEYQRDEKITKSTLGVNHFTQDQINAQEQLKQGIRENPQYVHPSYILDPSFDKTKIDEANEIEIDTTESPKVEEKRTTLATGDMKNLLSMKSLDKEDWTDTDNFCAMPLPSN